MKTQNKITKDISVISDDVTCSNSPSHSSSTSSLAINSNQSSNNHAELKEIKRKFKQNNIKFSI